MVSTCGYVLRQWQIAAHFMHLRVVFKDTHFTTWTLNWHTNKWNKPALPYCFHAQTFRQFRIICQVYVCLVSDTELSFHGVNDRGISAQVHKTSTHNGVFTYHISRQVVDICYDVCAIVISYESYARLNSYLYMAIFCSKHLICVRTCDNVTSRKI